MNISRMRTISAIAGQSAKSTLANPVVVMIETTWKDAWRNAASPAAKPDAQISTVTIAVAATRIPRYSRSSSSRSAARGRLRTIAR